MKILIYKIVKKIIKSIVIFIMILFLLNIKSFSQDMNLGVGIGFSSSGDVPVIMTLQIKKVGGYISYVADKDPITYDYNEKYWHTETTFGTSYEVFSDYPKVNVLTGIGWNKTTYWYRETTFPNSLHNTESNGISYEGGFNVQLYKFISLTALMNNYSGLKTMVTIKYFFK